MSSKSTKARHRRFDGHGNVRVDGHPRWQLICDCGAVSKALNTHNSPNALIKKFEQLGWEVGLKQDVCPECQKKVVASHVPLAKKAWQDMMSPMVRDESGKASQFKDLKTLAANLDDAQAKELRRILREHNPTAKPPRPKKAPPPDDPEYEKWLADDDSQSDPSS